MTDALARIEGAKWTIPEVEITTTSRAATLQVAELLLLQQYRSVACNAFCADHASYTFHNAATGHTIWLICRFEDKPYWIEWRICIVSNGLIEGRFSNTGYLSPDKAYHGAEYIQALSQYGQNRIAVLPVIA